MIIDVKRSETSESSGSGGGGSDGARDVSGAKVVWQLAAGWTPRAVGGSALGPRGAYRVRIEH